MAVDYENGLKNLGSLIKSLESERDRNRNEATTRLQLIDHLLFQCLGWDTEDCNAEELTNKEYIDYGLYCAGACLLIVEAKREGIYFDIPVGSNRLIFDIRLFRSQPAFLKAIEQAAAYCQAHGTPFAAVSNGHQLAAFIASRADGRPPLEGKVLIFDSLQRMEAHFLKAWECLSKPGIMERRLSTSLLDSIAAPPPAKPSAGIMGYPGSKRRNQLQTDLEILAELFIENLRRGNENEDEEEDFLKNCYCKSGALSQYATVSKDILRERYSALSDSVGTAVTLDPATTKDGLPDKALLAQLLTGKPVLLIGDRGVGKTMFIKHLYKVAAPEIFSNALVFYIDFGSTPSLVNELRTFTAAEIRRQFLDIHGIDIRERNFVFAVLHKEVEEFERSVWGDIRDTNRETFRLKRIEHLAEIEGDVDEYLKRCFTHIVRGRRQQIVIFLDNVDQREAEFQENIFLLGQTMASSWPVTVFVSLRPETFSRSRLTGTLSAYHARAFTVPPPRVDEVIMKRLSYGITLTQRGIKLFDRASVASERLGDYLKVLMFSFDKNRALIEFLDNMCGGNIRLALDFIRQFIGSGHVDTQKILDKYGQTGSYLVPLHEFLRAVIYGDHEHYFPADSAILNLFDISTADGKEHFLLPILLAHLDRWAQHSPAGYVPVTDVYAIMQDLGFGPDQIKQALRRAETRNLVEPPPQSKETGVDDRRPTNVTQWRITTVGAYYVKRLVRQFSYVDAMTVDTPILDKTFRSETGAAALTDRLARATRFLNYLDSQWSLLPKRELPFDWSETRNAIDADVERARRSSMQQSA